MACDGMDAGAVSEAASDGGICLSPLILYPSGSAPGLCRGRRSDPIGYLPVGDIRLRSQMLRRCLLVLGLLALILHLLFVTAYMNLWPDFMVNCLPLRIWLATISSTGNELMRYSPMFLSGCLLFLSLNK